MTAPLSTHSVHVPPRQTVHETAQLSEEAASIVLTAVVYKDAPRGALPRRRRRARARAGRDERRRCEEWEQILS